MKRSMSLVMVVLGLMGLVLLAGCDSGGGNNTPTNAGSVRGQVVAGVDNPVGFGGVTIIIGGQVDVTDANGLFQVNGIAPGVYEVEVIVNPETGFVVPPNSDPIVVNVLAGQTTQLPDPITVVDINDIPPGPP